MFTLNELKDFFTVAKLPTGNIKVGKHNASKKNYKHEHIPSKGQLKDINNALAKKYADLEEKNDLPKL